MVLFTILFLYSELETGFHSFGLILSFVILFFFSQIFIINLKDSNYMITIQFQNEDGLMDYFESVVKMTKAEPRKVIGWVMNELMGNLNIQNLKVSQR